MPAQTSTAWVLEDQKGFGSLTPRSAHISSHNSQHPKSQASPISIPDWDSTCSHGVFHETALVSMPSTLDFIETSTLTCSGLMAWNALFGIAGHVPKEGSFVILQGSGGVCIAALQFAVAVGATVIATTSSDAKADRLRALGANHVINCRTDSAWGKTAKSLIYNRKGVDIVVDVGGLSTLPQSFKAVNTNGVIALTTMLAQSEDGCRAFSDGLHVECESLLGTRDQFVEMNRFIELKGIKPVVGEKIFGFRYAKEAFGYLEGQKHISLRFVFGWTKIIL
ncbi:zinc-binding alcohol dehydrogenase-like protein [Penicillium canescens]|uniref:Zinc-binding alcohol dehydrogenase-like protein n=1 Tax=Penicillium canescens TaxID=5083 RepID=A0AAD6IJQ1_PENCN|nr:zinc-binding alcohol dehydrogenase-like protein [Penicillium canescens]KAJ6051756.1 zinc-binding alcohol dehydrogenase-like protein [Penicillium canescens]KAJ6062272.1 zinc-binding alcohol dehydrogenase-like protein [Penicillium canescens]KAJ6065519.1 zinc-binding alcohol dehydrogenase-like protein [Penicillium canescens]